MLMGSDRRVPCIVILVITHSCTTLAPIGSLPWPNADKVISAICPYTNICGVPHQAGPKDQCCTACNCGDNCAGQHADTCCFHNKVKSEYETCMYLRSKSNIAFGFTPGELKTSSFYVITKQPNSGCLDKNGSCLTTDLSSISPMYSRSTEKIYFNKECAVCHGIEEVVESELMFVCDDSGMPDSFNFDVELIKFLNGDISSICFLTYQFSTVNILHRRCAIHAADSINKLMNISKEDQPKNYFNMSIDDIASACSSNFFAPVLSASKQKLYPNPFCYIYGEGTHVKEICRTQTGTPSGYGFIALLNPKVVEIVRSDKKQQPITQEEVCLKTIFDSGHSKYDTCRPVSCPLGHVFDQHGDCSYIGSRVMVQGRPNIFLNLFLKSSDEMGFSESTYVNISTEYLTNTVQLPSEWKIAFWGISVESDGSPRGEGILMTLQLVFHDVPKGISSIGQLLNKEVMILNKAFSISIYQQKLSLIKVIPINFLNTVQCSDEIKVNDIPENEETVAKCWKIISLNIYAYSAVFVEPLSKLYFCNLVQLKTGEYRLIANGTLLLNQIQGKYLHGNEFIVLTGEDGEKIVKICQEDSGLEKFKNSSTINTGLPLLILIGLLLFRI